MPIVKTDAPTFLRSKKEDNWIALGFDGSVISRLKKNKGIYFVSWSQDFLNFDAFFSGTVNFFDHDEMGSKDWEPKFVQVKVTGPWPADQIYNYIPYSTFDSVQDAQEYIAHHSESNSQILPTYPIYMWRADRC